MGMPPGMMDPRMMDPRMLQQMQAAAQQQQQQTGQQKEETKAQARERANPLPFGRPGLQTLRALSDCPIPDEAGQIKKLLDKLLALELVDIEEPLKIVGEGIASVIMADTYCLKHKTQRAVVRFEEDEELQKYHKDLQDLQKRLGELKQELADISQAAQAANKGRWETAVKKFGLAPEKFTYELDEEAGVIYLTDLKCNECTGRTKTRKARQTVAEKLVTFERIAKEEKENDRPRTRTDKPDPPNESSGNVGKASVSEQEVSGVADPAVDDDGNGDNGSGETA